MPRCDRGAQRAARRACSADDAHTHNTKKPPPQGYARPQQVAAGIYTRLYARAYVIGDLHDDRHVSSVMCVVRAFKRGGGGGGSTPAHIKKPSDAHNKHAS